MTRTGDAAVTEGHEGTRDVHIQVGLTQAYPFNVNVTYQTVDGDAVAGADYDAKSGVLTIGGGTTSRSLTLTVRGDTIDEIDETFRLRLVTTIGCVSEIRYATITIVDDDVPNRTPVLTNPGDRTNLEGDAVTLVINASDPDVVDTLTFSAAALPPGLSIDADTGAIAGTVAAGSAGPYQVVIEVSDGALSDSVTFLWTIRIPNRGPELSPVASRTDAEGDSVSLALSASDLDGDLLTYGASGLPPGISIDPSSGTITGTLSPGSHGSYTVGVSVSDGQLSATGSFLWTVTAAPPPPSGNHAPMCDAARPTLDVIWPPNHKKTHVVGVQGVTDPDGDPISITITAIWQDESTNTVGDGNTPVDGYGVGTSQADVRAERSGTPKVPGDGRLYEIFFTASDGAGGTCTGAVRTGVPHDMGQHRTVVDSIVRYDSTSGMRVR